MSKTYLPHISGRYKHGLLDIVIRLRCGYSRGYPSPRNLIARFRKLSGIGPLLFAFGVVLYPHPTFAFETPIADTKVRAVVEKRKTLIDAIPDEKLKQMFPLPQDKTTLIGECLRLEGEVEERRCLEMLAQGYFEGHFTEEAQTVCGLLQNAIFGEHYAKRCLCYSAPNFAAIDECLTKENKNLQGLLKAQEQASLSERLLAPLQSGTPKATSASALQKEKTPPKAVDLNGELLGEPLPPKEPGTTPTQTDEAAQAVLNSFLETLQNKKYFEIFTPESYALFLFAPIQFAKRETIAQGLKGARAHFVDADTVKLLPADSQGAHNYLIKRGEEWYLDNLRAHVEQKNAAGAPPIAELDEFLEKKDVWVPLVQKAIQTCKALKNNYVAQEGRECPEQLMEKET